MRGPLESRYLQVHPDASTGLDVCQWFQRHPNQWFTHAEIKAANRCSDRIIREHLPAALNEPGRVLIEVDQTETAWRYRYVPAPDATTASGVPHLDSVDELRKAIPSLDLEHDRGLRIAATFEWRGSTWNVSWETYRARLRDFCDHVLAGREIYERSTKHGHGLSDRPGRPDRLYIYLSQDGTGAGASRPRARQSSTTSCCGLTQPAGSDCAFCGQPVQ